jgi:hypothetical protein
VAKKAKAPQPPKRVQAPKRRQPTRGGSSPDRQKYVLFGVAGAGLVGLVVALIVVFATGSSGAGNSAPVAAAMQEAGCTFRTVKAQPSANHIQTQNQVVAYKTFPPVSGPHHPTPAIWGNYRQAVDPRQAVHNQEHGGVVIWLGPKVAAADREAIARFYDESPDAMLVTRLDDTAQYVKYPKHASVGSKIALTSWTSEISGGKPVNGLDRIAVCPRFDEAAFTSFRDEFRGKGPERFPVDRLPPGR